MAWLTARRTGIKRTAARVRRIFLLHVVYPRFAGHLYPLRKVEVPQRVCTLPPLVVGEQGDWNGKICLLHTAPLAMCVPFDWKANPIGQTLWQFRLHEWEWAYPLIHQAQRDTEAAFELKALLEDYWNAVPLGDATAYEPYPLSRRLVVWCEALRVLGNKIGDPELLETLAGEMDRGARMLADNIEHDLDNNHVIANAKALAFVGTLLEQPYTQMGFALFWEQLRLQVRADGVHVENSTMYHFLVWRDAVQVSLLAKTYHVEIPGDIVPRIIAMRDFLSAVRHTDGTFPLWNDSVQDEFENFDSYQRKFQESFALEDSAGSIALSILFPESRYAVLQNGETQLTFDGGALGPTYCPGHGHADTLSFELFAYGQPRIVDAGTFQYQAGESRDFFRGTAAHNTLQVDGLDSSEVSGSFRVGRMAKAHLWLEKEWVCGEHDGYTRLREPVTHRRKIQLADADTVLIRDEIRGRGAHTYALRFQIAPNARATIFDKVVTIRYPDGLTLEMDCAGAPTIPQMGQGWYSPTWYTKYAVDVIELFWQGPPPFEIETRFTLDCN